MHGSLGGTGGSYLGAERQNWHSVFRDSLSINFYVSSIKVVQESHYGSVLARF